MQLPYPEARFPVHGRQVGDQWPQALQVIDADRSIVPFQVSHGTRQLLDGASELIFWHQQIMVMEASQVKEAEFSF